MGKPTAQIGNEHTCPAYSGDTPHRGGPILPCGNTSVLVASKPSACQGDQAQCNGPLDVIQGGSSSVLIGGKPAARQGDQTVHGGVITQGEPSVLIG
jgi:uncharacterized Zn-binding protein involved in type VI secretion